MSDFIFRVSSVKLSAEQEKKIASAIQRAVLTKLAQLDLGTHPSAPDVLLRPIKWYGGFLLQASEVSRNANTNFTVTEKTAT